MSLFTSAFDGGHNGGPSLAASSSSASKTNKKRKRPSSSAHPPLDQLKGVQASLDKLMKAADAGRLDRPSKSGGESIGQGGKKKKPFKASQLEAGPSKSTHPDVRPKKVPQPSKQAKPKDGEKPKHGGNSKKDVHAARVPSTQPPTETNVAEMPMPHHTPSAKKKGKAASGDLTAVQSGLQAKLDGARFRQVLSPQADHTAHTPRWINEQIYSVPSTQAVEMMRKEPKIFEDVCPLAYICVLWLMWQYHASHRAQTAAWPSPPLPRIISLLSPLPKGTVIADLGCGDAELARTLVPQGKVVLSYDLVGDVGSSASEAAQGWVVEADFLTHVPLPGRPGGVDEEAEAAKPRKGKEAAKACEVVDVVVCCLSLMGTNWLGGIYEACRILKEG